MKQTEILFIFLILIVLGSCSENHLINNKDYRTLVEKRFNERKQLAANREQELFSVFGKKISEQQSEALKFLLAFMPVSDLADYDGDFFLANVDLSLRTKKETNWGMEIPEDIFLHYVLPVRVNNENLDSFRIAYYDEIMSRVSRLDLKEAALEINHWCHEKVAYQPSDIRTSSPVATILSARGRCGEESTLAVAALRTAGIPARQVYTPRWAHSDDNHAWVEIWDKGEWYYMGACEPEPVLDRGWFTEPARRAMLVHTKSFGAQYGNENTINIFKNFSEVNNLSKYAVTKRIYVQVTNEAGMPEENARVEYKLYNYAEFYPLALVPTDEHGINRFETGLGDLLIWASKDERYDFMKISVDETDTVKLKLGRTNSNGDRLDIDLSVPIVRTPLPGIPAELAAENEKLIVEENRKRQEYIRSWIQPEEVRLFARGKNIDSVRLKSVFSRTMGNYNELMTFISMVPDTLMDKALSLLEVITDKDLRDTKAVVLSDHLFYCNMTSSQLAQPGSADKIKYVLNPRISNEMLSPWRSYFRSALPEKVIRDARQDPSLLIRYIDDTIHVADDENFYKTPITPVGVHELKVSDSWSRSICFVAICRSLGIPSRLEEGRLIPQYFGNGKWNDVYFADQVPPSPEKAFIKFSSTDTKPVPEYYTHFTLARLERGRFVTLAYDYNRKVTDFKEEIALPPGKYMLVTGNRISDSKILTSLAFFDLKENEHRAINVSLRQDASEKKILGRLELKKVLSLHDNNNDLAESVRNKGVVIIWIDPEKEPTRHIFNDLPLLKSELDAWGGYFIFLNGKSATSVSFDPASLKGLPLNSLFGNDNNLELFGSSTDIKTFPDTELPIVVVSDKDGNIFYVSSGYRIGIGEQILKHVL